MLMTNEMKREEKKCSNSSSVSKHIHEKNRQRDSFREARGKEQKRD